MDLEPRFDWTRASPIISNMVLFFHNDCVDTHSEIKQRSFPGSWHILALNGSQLQMPWNYTTVHSAVSRSTEIKPFEDGLVHMCRYHLHLNRNFFGFNMPSRSYRACIIWLFFLIVLFHETCKYVMKGIVLVSIIAIYFGIFNFCSLACLTYFFVHKGFRFRSSVLFNFLVFKVIQSL